MRYWLHVHGTHPDPGGRRLERSTLTLADEVLCGGCGALLAIDHKIWVNAGEGDPPGARDGQLDCGLCGRDLDASWAVTTDPHPRDRHGHDDVVPAARQPLARRSAAES